jgi:hypothetical protein
MAADPGTVGPATTVWSYRQGAQVGDTGFVPYDPVAGGATRIDGDIDPQVRIDFQSTTATAGLFRQRPGRVEITWPCTEHAFVLHGQVTVTYLATGERVTYRPGDGWTHRKGERIVWEVATERFVKSFFLLNDE